MTTTNDPAQAAKFDLDAAIDHLDTAGGYIAPVRDRYLGDELSFAAHELFHTIEHALNRLRVFRGALVDEQHSRERVPASEQSTRNPNSIVRHPYWDCSQCDKRVSRQSGHAHLRVRRANSTGWDHKRCVPDTKP